MSNTLFRAHSRAVLESIAAALEEADASGEIEVELHEGILTIEFESGRQIVLSCHEPSQQIWLASPRLGGLHFSPSGDFAQWALADGRTLSQLLAAELQELGKLDIAL